MRERRVAIAVRAAASAAAVAVTILVVTFPHDSMAFFHGAKPSCLATSSWTGTLGRDPAAAGGYRRDRTRQRLARRTTSVAAHSRRRDSDRVEFTSEPLPDADSLGSLPSRKSKSHNGGENELPPENHSLEPAIDSFLRGEYALPFAPDAPAPHPGLGPGETVEVSLRSLRDLDVPHASHGAAVFLRFCTPLTRGERWGSGHDPYDAGVKKRGKEEGGGLPRTGRDPWKELLRGSLTPPMLARRLRASLQFSGLLDWTTLDVTEGASSPSPNGGLVHQSTTAYVNAALHFGKGLSPSIVHFTLEKIGAAWFIDTALLGNQEEEMIVGWDDEGDSVETLG